MKTPLTLASLIFLGTTPLLIAQEATIQVHPKQTISHVTRYMTGACLEDVNHEVYGGLYSQMIFGESFQEPAWLAPIKDFTAHGGRWSLNNGVVSVAAEAGPKLVADRQIIAAGEVGVEVFLPGNVGGVAGLVVKVQEPGLGADKFIGYEIALSTEPQFLLLGRHRHNWEPLKNVPYTVPSDRWIPLVVRLGKTSLEVLVDGKSILTYEDRDHPLKPGAIALRNFNRPCRYRDLWIKTDDKVTRLPFEPLKRWNAGVSGMWRGLRSGTAIGELSLETKDPFIGRQSQRIRFEQGQGGVGMDNKGALGIENRGLNRWGMHFVKGKPYEGYVWARADKRMPIMVALESGDGAKVYAAQWKGMSKAGWQRIDFTLTPNASDEAGRFAIKLDDFRPVSVLIGHVFLQPGEWGRFKGLPIRKEVAEALIAQGLTALRYGGSMVNAAEYRWKKMIGPRDRRPMYQGTWYPDSTNGWGIIDFLDFCEEAGFLPIPAFNMDESPQDMADFVEYVNGPADSPWGRKRDADAHPPTYRLKHLELGNEEAVTEDYWKRFKPMAEAIWAKDRDIIIVVGDFLYNDHIKDPFQFRGAPLIKSLATHQKILELAKKHGRPVWFDVHVWNDNPRDPDQLSGGIIGLSDFGAALKTLCPGADFKVCVFEENSGNHTLRRGLAHAHAINKLERLGDLVPIVCAANCLQPDRQNDNGWDQGLLFLNPSRVWGHSSYYVTQMVSRNYLPRCIRADVKSPGHALEVTAKTNEEGKVLTLQVVNLHKTPLKTTIDLEGFSPSKPMAHISELAGRLEDVNTPEQPQRIISKERDWKYSLENGLLEYTFPPNSFTIIRLE